MAELDPRMAAQIAYFASDDYIREEVAVWRDTSPAQRLAEVAEMCAAGAFFWDRLDDATRARIRAAEALPADTIALLERLRSA